MQFCEDIEKVIKEYTRPYRDPKSHKNHKRVMEQLKRISKVWRNILREERHNKTYYWIVVGNWFFYPRPHITPVFVKTVQRCF